jgi:hypothetical protein
VDIKANIYQSALIHKESGSYTKLNIVIGQRFLFAQRGVAILICVGRQEVKNSQKGFLICTEVLKIQI